MTRLLGRFAVVLSALVGTGFFSLSTRAQAAEIYSEVRIFISGPEDIRALQCAGLAFGHIRLNPGSFDVELDEGEVERLQGLGWPHQVLIEDLVADYGRRKAMPASAREALKRAVKEEFPVRGLELGSMGGFYTFDEVVAELDSMRLLYPHLVSARQAIGSSVEGRPLWMVKISDHPEADEGEVEILYTGLHHADEPQSMMAVLYFMYYLLEHYQIDPEATFLVENRELYFVPVVNPDGYVYNQQQSPDGGGRWRTNRRENRNGTFGVDLNRNYGYQWGLDGGSSSRAGSATYRGTAPFSEPETQAIREFCTRREIRLCLNYHDYQASALIYPWGYTRALTPDSTTYIALAAEMTRLNGYEYGTVFQTLGYVANGNSDDWMYGEQAAKNKIFALSPEVGAGKWPYPDEIFPFAQRTLHMNLVLARGAGVVVDDVVATDIGEAPESFGAVAVRPNFPNPFNAATTISYRLSRTRAVRLVIYDLLGQKVRTLLDGSAAPGTHCARWDGRDDRGVEVGSGVYILHFAAGDFRAGYKMMFAK